MKVEVSSVGTCPMPQFTVSAENETERALFRAFLTFLDYAKDDWKYGMTTHTYTGDLGYTSFTFGIVEDPKTGPEFNPIKEHNNEYDI